MSLKNLTSIHDLVQGDTAPVGDMENQTGPNFPILGPGVFDKGPVSGVPTKSPLHSNGIAQPGKSVSLLGPSYKYAYGDAATSVDRSNHDLNGQTPDEYIANLPD